MSRVSGAGTAVITLRRGDGRRKGDPRDGDLRLLTGLYTAQTLVAGALQVLIVVIAFDLLGTGEGGIGYLNAAVGAGGLVGGFVALVLATRKRLASDFGLGVALFGVPLALIAVFDSMPVALAGLAIIGLGNSLVDISAITIMQRTVPDAVLGRALGALDAILLGSIGFGAVLTPRSSTSSVSMRHSSGSVCCCPCWSS